MYKHIMKARNEQTAMLSSSITSRPNSFDAKSMNPPSKSSRIELAAECCSCSSKKVLYSTNYTVNVLKHMPMPDIRQDGLRCIHRLRKLRDVCGW